MLRYTLKRLLFAIPTLWCITVAVFFLSQFSQQDPIEGHFRDEMSSNRTLPPRYAYAQYTARGRELGLDKPLFYFALLPYSYPDTLHRILDKNRIDALKMWLQRCGNWHTVEQYYTALQTLEQADIRDRACPVSNNDWQNTLARLHIQNNPEVADTLLSALIRDAAVCLPDEAHALKIATQKLHETRSAWLNYVPTLRWYGTDCQYHRWFRAMLGGDFGVSYTDQLPVGTRLARPLAITLLMSALSILLAYLLAVPLGVTLAARPQARWARWADEFLMGLYALPTFWIATLMVVFLTNDRYHLHVASVGLRDLPSETPLFWLLWLNLPRFVLPVLCMALHHSVWLTRQLRVTMVEILQKDFIRTARANGMTERQVVWKFAFRNALFPLISLFGYLLPTVVTGSLVCEVVFSIPGFGRLTFDAMQAQDTPMIFAITLIVAAVTIIGTLLTDLCYVWANPKTTIG